MMDYLNLLSPPGIPSFELKLKPGAVCAVIRNLSIHNGLVKNARVMVEKLARNLIEVKLLTPRFAPRHSIDGRTLCIPRINFQFQPLFTPWTVARTQFPLRLAYSTTFTSSQGLTFNRVVVDLRTSVFAHGQLYTALSRVRTRHDVRVLWAEDNRERGTPNIVHSELLL